MWIWRHLVVIFSSGLMQWRVGDTHSPHDSWLFFTLQSQVGVRVHPKNLNNLILRIFWTKFAEENMQIEKTAFFVFLNHEQCKTMCIFVSIKLNKSKFFMNGGTGSVLHAKCRLLQVQDIITSLSKLFSKCSYKCKVSDPRNTIDWNIMSSVMITG